jgi:hypothetical protein
MWTVLGVKFKIKFVLKFKLIKWSVCRFSNSLFCYFLLLYLQAKQWGGRSPSARTLALWARWRPLEEIRVGDSQVVSAEFSLHFCCLLILTWAQRFIYSFHLCLGSGWFKHYLHLHDIQTGTVGSAEVLWCLKDLRW